MELLRVIINIPLNYILQSREYYFILKHNVFVSNNFHSTEMILTIKNNSEFYFSFYDKLKLYKNNNNNQDILSSNC